MLDVNSDRLVQNLKALNAKERDHLMRFAYLGNAGVYGDNVDNWLSPQMIATLIEKDLVPEDARCIFAGMDYHLDWLHAALSLSCKGQFVRKDPLDEVSFPCRGTDGLDNDDASLRPVNGRQEDLDLLAVFSSSAEDKVVVLFIEAKGVSLVDPKQLARKLIRLDRILESSCALDHRPRLDWKFVLVGPTPPEEKSVLDIARQCKCESLRALMLSDKHANGIGKGAMNFIKLAGFPDVGADNKKYLRRITRIPIANQPGVYENWKIATR